MGSLYLTFCDYFPLAVTGKQGKPSFSPLINRPCSGPPRSTAVGMLNARVAISPRLVLAPIDSVQRISRNYAAGAHPQDMPRGHVGIVGALEGDCLSLTGSFIKLPYYCPTLFFSHATHEVPYPHMIISTHPPHRLWRSSGICAFILVLSSSLSRVVFPLPSLHCPPPPSPLSIHAHATQLLSCFFFWFEHTSEPRPSHRSL